MPAARRSRGDARQDGPTETVARYLEAIFYIDAEGEAVRAARLAEWLDVSAATVAATLRRMSDQGLIEVSARKEVTLTPEGRGRASGIVRRHRIAERWLTDVLDFDWLAADEEASRLGHALSDAVADRLFEHIGRPRTCPHGNWIPGADRVPGRERALRDLSLGERSRVRRISEVAEHEVPALLRFLAEHGFSLGAPVEVAEISEAADTVTVLVDERAVTLSLGVAAKIQVDA